MDDLEFWLKGSIPEIPLLLQPVAHALLQVQKELQEVFLDFDENKLWEKPRNVASVGFHLNHLTGVLDRLFTYATGESLSVEQLVFLKNEGIENNQTNSIELLKAFDLQVIKSLDQLKATYQETLTEPRFVGRKMLPSTVIGLLFHAAEHTTRHFGQLLVTIKIL
ncbi:MAG: DinB family protein [Leadbetterella sp.]|nr:DinB family protein [Leadbetterella sp.]